MTDSNEDSGVPEGDGSTIRLRPKEEGQEIRISETVLKRKYRDLKGAADRAWIRAQAKQNVKRLRKLHLITSAEKCVVNQRQLDVDKKRFDCIAKQPLPRVRSRAPVLLAVRNTLKNFCDETKLTLNEIGLRQYFSARFVPNTRESLHRLRLVEPFVFFGYPTAETIRTLFLRRGAVERKLDASDVGNIEEEEVSEEEADFASENYAAKKGRRLQKTKAALSDNARIEEDLGHLGLLCVEDLVRQTEICGPHFEAVMNYLGSFELSNLHKVEGWNKESSFLKGNLRHDINVKVQQIA